jgi:hypothetical protein
MTAALIRHTLEKLAREAGKRSAQHYFIASKGANMNIKSVAATAAVFLALSASAATAVELVQNGGFESGNLTGWSGS